MKFFEITNEVKNLESLFLEQIDQETGEIKDSTALEELDKEVKETLTSKTENIIQGLRMQEKYLEELNEELETFKKFVAKKQKEHENFKKYLIRNLKEMDLKKVETPIGSLVYNETYSTDIFDNSLVPDVFKTEEIQQKTVLKVDKNEIKKMLKKGVEVPGARLIINNNLLIKK